ncbi:hypothetical protein OEZ86_013267 [Tetradesmus obliquus]|nr:hypothetical protein OEZ86_013267 [Tetradesmus obliquus]
MADIALPQGQGRSAAYDAIMSHVEGELRAASGAYLMAQCLEVMHRPAEALASSIRRRPPWPPPYSRSTRRASWQASARTLLPLPLRLLRPRLLRHHTTCLRRHQRHLPASPGATVVAVRPQLTRAAEHLSCAASGVPAALAG